MELGRAVTDYLLSRGAGLVGYANLTRLPGEVRDEMPGAIAFAVPLRAEIVAGLSNGPTREYYEEYKLVNRLLSKLSEGLALLLREHGFRAISSPATTENFDPLTCSTVLPHKTVATLAGLGWIGKCALLVTEEFGSAVRINRVLTNAPLSPARPVEFSRCGDCSSCVVACPGHAPRGREWQSGIRREEFFDADRCRRTALALATQRTGIPSTFCGICIAVCPWTRKYLQRHAAKKTV